ncbi:MAG: hypothetical protein LBL90_10580 [Prevotellaceae bacterium]|jgi:hypothetical protein|nr:hypothetical protein [Prevotellaceae bacterium]
MKFIKLLLPVLSAVLLLVACVEVYEEPTGPEFKGTYVWRYTHDYVNGTFHKYEGKTNEDSIFIHISAQEIRRYIHAMRDSSSSMDYFLDRENNEDIYGLPLGDENIGNLTQYIYYATYRFSGDTLILERFPEKNSLLDKTPSKVLTREAWVRPGKSKAIIVEE